MRTAWSQLRTGVQRLRKVCLWVYSTLYLQTLHLGGIIQLWEEDGSGVRNYVVSLDDQEEQLLFVYDYRMRLGLDVELQESDVITGYGLTTAAFTYESKSGMIVTSPAVFTYFVE